MITWDVAQEVLPKSWRFSRQYLRRVSYAFEVTLPKASGKVHVHIVDEAEIRRMNRLHLGKDQVTDVLSFPSGDAPIFGELGDVLICAVQAERQSAGDMELELTDLLVHGVLHLLGYDHLRAEDADRMFPLQDAIVARILTPV